MEQVESESEAQSAESAPQAKADSAKEKSAKVPSSKSLLNDFYAAAKKNSCGKILKTGLALKKRDLDLFKQRVLKNKTYVSCTKKSK